MTTPAKPRQDSLFPGEPNAHPGPGAYPGRRKGTYDDARCAVCGLPVADHPTVLYCYRHFPVTATESPRCA